MGSFVDVTGIPLRFLEVLGYILFEENEDFELLVNKGQPHLLPKEGSRLLYVEDDNDVSILRARRRIPAPPKGDGSN
jgi:hypothetical protein